MTTARDVIEEARGHGYYSDARRDLMFRAFNQADADSDLDTAFEAREAFINAMYGAPASLQMVAAFAWCLARADEDPDRFSINLWYYKWVIEAVLASAETSMEQMKALIDDMDRRFTEAEASRGPVLKARLRMAERFDRDRVADVAQQWSDSYRVSRGRLNDCSTCDAATEAGAWQVVGEHEKAIEAADGLLNGKMRCGLQPHATLGSMLQSFRALGRWEEAERHHRKGVSLIERRLSDFPATAGNHLRHMAATGSVDDGLLLLVDAFPRRRIDDSDWFALVRGGRSILLAADRRGISYPPAEELRDTILAAAPEIADRFDRSENGDHNTRLLDADVAEVLTRRS